MLKSYSLISVTLFLSPMASGVLPCSWPQSTQAFPQEQAETSHLKHGA
jgi:hypothetical protein